ncbi:MAG: response regulator transcription factor [Prevotella sp.]|nr:response regulator transcription factor [Prevotella sp.]
MIKTVIVEDDPNDVKALEESLSRYQQVEIVCTCNSGEKGLAAITKYSPDLLFLDIEIPGMTGLEFLDNLGAEILQKCRVVIYTAYSHYAVDTFRKKAFDFLIKPIDAEDLDGIIQRVENSWEVSVSNEDGNVVRAEKELMVLLDGNGMTVVRLRDIAFFQYDSNEKVWNVVYANKNETKSVESRSLKHHVQASDIIHLSDGFVQVHRKYIVNIYYIQTIRKDGVCVLYPPFESMDEITVTYKYRKRLLDKFLNL